MAEHDRPEKSSGRPGGKADGPPSVRPGRDTTSGILALQRLVGNAEVNRLLKGAAGSPAPALVQRHLAEGHYAVKSATALRHDVDKDYAPFAQLPQGSPAEVIDKGERQSMFKGGWFLTNDHSWSQASGRGPGWIDDDELAKAETYVFSNDAKPTAEMLTGFFARATAEQKKRAAGDDKFLARAKKALGRDRYLELLPELGVHRQPDRVLPPQKKGPGAKGHMTGPAADVAIRDHLQAYLAGAMAAHRQVEGEVSVVGDEDFQAAFDRQWVDAAKQRQYVGKKAWDICDAFVDVNLPKRHIWVHRSFGDIGTVIHEGMHKYADSTLRNEQIAMCNVKRITHGGVSRLDEGITEYFARKVIIDHLKLPRSDYYLVERKVVDKLVAQHGEAVVARAYFDGDFAALKSAFGNGWDEFSEKLETLDVSWLLANGHMA